MKVHIHPCGKKNIGDEFNLWFWQEILGEDTLHLLPDDELLVGIGTVLNDKLPSARAIHILGSGVGYGNADSIKPGQNWTIHFVRGLLSAKSLGIDASLAISDPGILISKLRPRDKKRNIGISFMPHIGIDSPRSRRLIESIGWNYISPSDDEHCILDSIASSEKLVTSAMHGAIIADSYRTPWLPINTSPEILPFKWRDWFSSLNIDAELQTVPAYWPIVQSNPKSFVVNMIKTYQLKKCLKQLEERGNFHLSDENILNQKQNELLEKLDSVKQLWMDESNR